MKKTLITVLLLSTSWAAFGQSKIGLASQLELLKLRSQNLPVYNARTRSVERLAPQNYTTAMVALKDKSALEELKAKGAKILTVRGDIAIISVAVNNVERVANVKSVSRLDLPQPVYPKMDRARKAVGIDKIHQGLELPQAYTGKGVVAGIVDAGIEPNHINFLDANGNTRVAYFGKITQNVTERDGYLWENFYHKEVLDTMSNRTYKDHDIQFFHSDDSTGYHGTHTMGIMAGGYKGNMTYASLADDDRTTSLVTGPNPFYGGATESEIVAQGGTLADQYIALGIDNILQYAAISGEKKKPVVVNLSLGSNVGSHDARSTMNRFLAECGKEALICVAAGNEADVPIAYTARFSAANVEKKTMIRPNQEGELIPNPNADNPTKYYNLRTGQLAAYSQDSTAFVFQIVVVNTKRNVPAARFTIANDTKGVPIAYTSNTSRYPIGGAKVNNTFKNAFDGYVLAASQLDPETGRYYVMAQFLTSDNQDKNANEEYRLGVVIKSKKPGQRVDMYCDPTMTHFDNYNMAGWDPGTKDGTISDMACAENVITVGSYNIRNHWAALDKSIRGFRNDDDTFQFPEGKVSDFSSWGTIPDGRSLPHVCAPGAAIISSINSYYVEHPKINVQSWRLQGELERTSKKLQTTDNNKYYWMEELGTSMATPVVAGAMALWLEANPELKVADAIRIIQATAVKDDDVKAGNPVQWGAGKFDAYAGLKMVLEEKEKTGIRGVKSADDAAKPVITMTGNRSFRTYLAGAKQLQVRAFTLAGQLVDTKTANGDELDMNASAWEKGVYLIQVNGGSAQRIIIY